MLTFTHEVSPMSVFGTDRDADAAMYMNIAIGNEDYAEPHDVTVQVLSFDEIIDRMLED